MNIPFVAVLAFALVNSSNFAIALSSENSRVFEAFYEHTNVEREGAGEGEGELAVSEEFFSCNKYDGAEKELCDFILAKINAELSEAGIAIESSSLLYTIDDSGIEKINTGHSCSVTAQVRHKSANARIEKGADLDFSGDALTEPVVIKLEMPLEVAAQVRIKQRYGARIFGSCSNYGSDSYIFRGKANTLAKVILVLDLSPSFGLTNEGNYKVALDPKVTVSAVTEDLDIDFMVSGISPITPVWSYLAGISSTLSRASTALLTGESASQVFEETAVFDFGAPVTLSLLDGAAGDLILDLLEKRQVRKTQQAVKGFALDLESSLNRKIREALGISETGERTFIIDKNYLDLIQLDSNLDDVLLEPTVADYCSWSYSWSSSRSGGGGIWGPVALGQKCTLAGVGTSIRSGNTTYTCQKTGITEITLPPRNFTLCEDSTPL